MNGFAVAAIVVGIIGFFFMAQVTMGVGIVCFACLLAIIARIRQQERHHEEMVKLLCESHGLIIKQ
ncbi:MAG: hypothetical protein PHU01_13135 [Desulfuromonadaceae bacterium]|nr:hypothetical protein [Desulfuromonadaceae bacterium]